LLRAVDTLSLLFSSSGKLPSVTKTAGLYSPPKAKSTMRSSFDLHTGVSW